MGRIYSLTISLHRQSRLNRKSDYKTYDGKTFSFGISVCLCALRTTQKMSPSNLLLEYRKIEKYENLYNIAIIRTCALMRRE